MQLNVYEPILKEYPSAKSLIMQLKENEKELALEDAIVYHRFPLYMDSDGSVKTTDVLVVSNNYGVLIFKTLDYSKRIPNPPLEKLLAEFEQVYTLIFSKLIKSKLLRDNPTNLNIQLKPIVYLFDDGYDPEEIKSIWDGIEVIKNPSDITIIFESIKSNKELDTTLIQEILSILEGSQSIRKIIERKLENLEKKSKGAILDEIEKQIATFDVDQKRAALPIIDGPQRIRGLAGSGKTIVLAMKTALIHIYEPEAKILYTYWTKQLHDFIKRLITIGKRPRLVKNRHYACLGWEKP